MDRNRSVIFLGMLFSMAFTGTSFAERSAEGAGRIPTYKQLKTVKGTYTEAGNTPAYIEQIEAKKQEKASVPAKVVVVPQPDVKMLKEQAQNRALRDLRNKKDAEALLKTKTKELEDKGAVLRSAQDAEDRRNIQEKEEVSSEADKPVEAASREAEVSEEEQESVQ